MYTFDSYAYDIKEKTMRSNKFRKNVFLLLLGYAAIESRVETDYAC